MFQPSQNWFHMEPSIDVPLSPVYRLMALTGAQKRTAEFWLEAAEGSYSQAVQLYADTLWVSSSPPQLHLQEEVGQKTAHMLNCGRDKIELLGNSFSLTKVVENGVQLFLAVGGTLLWIAFAAATSGAPRNSPK